MDLRFQGTKDSFLRSLEITTKPPSFYNQYIKALFLAYINTQENVDNINDAVTLLPYCKGVERFVCWISPDSVDSRLADVISVMRPRRLVARLTNLFDTQQPNFSLPFFDNVTHLEITDLFEWTAWSGIHRLPHLSHILLHVAEYYWTETMRTNAVQVVNDLLSQCGTLRVCVISHDDVDPVVDTFESIEDARLVFVSEPIVIDLDWHAFMGGTPDTWVYAGRAVAIQRRVGRIQARLVHQDFIRVGRSGYGDGRLDDRW